MVLLVETYLDKSQIEGIGLFAAEDIRKGTIIWKFRKGFDQVFTRNYINRLPACTRKWLSRYTFMDSTRGGLVLCGDDNRFVNHSTTPNIDDSGKYSVAKRFIRKGEELTSNYLETDDEASTGDLF